MKPVHRRLQTIRAAQERKRSRVVAIREEADQIIQELGFGRHAPGMAGTSRTIVITFDDARDLIRERSDG